MLSSYVLEQIFVNLDQEGGNLLLMFKCDS